MYSSRENRFCQFSCGLLYFLRMNTNPTALFVGRFQPFHNGHLLVVQGMAKLCGKIIIAIGSSQESGTADNPWTVQQRKDMIQNALQGVDLIPLHDIMFIEVPDEKDDGSWVKRVLELAGPVEQVWTGNAHTKKCFEGMGVEIRNIKEVPGISATEIRAKIKAKDESWKEKVPHEVVVVIQSKH